MIISVSRDCEIAKMDECELSLDEFLSLYEPSNVRETLNKLGRNYILGQLLDPKKNRGKGNIKNRCAVALDCDDATPDDLEALKEAVKGLGVRSVIHSTYSSTPTEPRVRVIIPLASPVAPGDYVSLVQALTAHLSMVEWDDTCVQAEQTMVMPCKRPGGDYWAEKTDGPLMDGLEWLKEHAPAHKARKSKGNVAKRDRKRKPESDPGIQGAFNRVYTIEDAIEAYSLPYEPAGEGRWTFDGADSPRGLRLVEDREDLCISEHANSDPAHFVDGRGSVRALSAFELCAVHLYGEGDDMSVAPRERASMEPMARRAAEDEKVRAEMGVKDDEVADISWLFNDLDDVNAQAHHAAAALRDSLAYSKGLGWLAYTPERGIWEQASESAALSRLAPIVRGWWKASLLTGREKFIKKVSKLRTAGSLRGILTHIEALVSVPASEFDADPALACATNGVVDLRTGELMPHDPKYLMTQQTATPYVPGAKHGAWDEALEALDADERGWFQRWVACGLTGHQPKDDGAATPILTGAGSNGKSVLMTAIAQAFGGYAYMGDDSLLMNGDKKDLLRAAAYLHGVRLCYVEELPGGVMSGVALKRVSATPTIKGEFKFERSFTFTATHSLMVSANEMPRLDEGTDGVIRRLAVLPFKYHYTENPSKPNDRKADPNLLEKLKTPEAQAAILAWAVEAAVAYFKAGKRLLPPTKAMQEAKDTWLGNVDILMCFFNDMLVADEKAMIPWTHLYAAFCDWQRENNGKDWNKSTFKNRVVSHRLFAGMTAGKLSTSGMSTYSGGFVHGLKTPGGPRVAGLRGVRFRRPSDDVAPVEAPEPVVEAPKPEAPVEAPEAPAAAELAKEVKALFQELKEAPGGREKAEKIAAHMGYTPECVDEGLLRAIKAGLEMVLIL